jgi:uncharacterized protein (TIGR03083 family)
VGDNRGVKDAGPSPLRSDVLASFDDGVAAIADASRHIRDWSSPTPCPDWSATDLAGHLLSIVRYYHRLLDAAGEGNPINGLPRGPDLAAMNASDLEQLEESAGAERVSEFNDLANSYGTRLAELGDIGWDRTLGIWDVLGPLTVGQHTGVAIGEWHVHVWDMARSLGRDHRPNDAFVVAQGNRVLRDIPADGDPWLGVLTAYGRDPEWTPIGT